MPWGRGARGEQGRVESEMEQGGRGKVGQELGGPTPGTAAAPAREGCPRGRGLNRGRDEGEG